MNPPFRIASLSAVAALQAELAGSSSGAQLLLQITGNPACGVDFYYVKFWTLGGAEETTESSGALMVPTGCARVLRGRVPSCCMRTARIPTRHSTLPISPTRPIPKAC